MDYRNIIETAEQTVVAESRTPYTVIKEYQSEAELEKSLIKQLVEQGYQYIDIKNEAGLIKNLRRQIEMLNDYTFTNEDWQRFFETDIANANARIREKTRTIQEDYIKAFKDSTGRTQNIYLLDKQNIHNNSLQVLNQYEVTGEGYAGEKRDNRYDVTILVNGLPLVHIELKRRGVQLKEAFNQISRYDRESFWAGSGLFEYIQLFVISNGTLTKYYSNTTRDSHVKENRNVNRGKNPSNSYEFTSYWAYESNKRIEDLREFTSTFFSKHTLLHILTKYCIFTSDENLMVMRPYQIAATEKILNRILTSYNQKYQGTKKSGGYIWHTTGSGKTLTSFKTARLASRLDYIDKVMFVVDRQDLDYQTMQEYEKFEKGAVNSNSNTKELEDNLVDSSKRILVTTIQKLSRFIARNKTHNVYSQNVVIIFDECHRSQFGQMHVDITKRFKKYFLFGFTGTPIFGVNASKSSAMLDVKTTEQAFGEKLHTYTVVDAIQDENVLKFRIDYVNTLKIADDVKDKKVKAIDIKRAEEAPERVSKIVSNILETFDSKTMRNSTYNLKEKRVRGFNAMFATPSIAALRLYYTEFKRQLSVLPSDKQLKIATIFSFTPNDDVDGVGEGGFPDENFDTESLDASDRDFLALAINDYNQMFNDSYTTSGDGFQNYYKDLSARIKRRELDLVLVVNMFLTGFDAKTLNTLWIDKNLRMHGLIQAFSRTNRILNSVKSYGNIICFRDLEENTNEAIGLYGDKEAAGIVLMKSFDDYYYGYHDGKKDFPGYVSLIEELTSNYPLPLQTMLYGETMQRHFVRLFGSILKLKNILQSFEEFQDKKILTDGEFQNYQSYYLELYDRYRPERNGEREVINDDLVFEMELVKSVEINIDYILMLVAKYHESNKDDYEILATIYSAVDSSPELRNKKDLIEAFIHRINVDSDVQDEWQEYIKEKKEEELNEIIVAENLKEDLTRRFIDSSFKNGAIKEVGTDIVNILPPTPLFGGAGNQAEKKARVLELLRKFFERFYGI